MVSFNSDTKVNKCLLVKTATTFKSNEHDQHGGLPVTG